MISIATSVTTGTNRYEPETIVLCTHVGVIMTYFRYQLYIYIVVNYCSGSVGRRMEIVTRLDGGVFSLLPADWNHSGAFIK